MDKKENEEKECEIKNFEFSDLISGYIEKFNGEKCFTMKTADGQNYTVLLGSNLFERMLRNLNEPYKDCTSAFNSCISSSVRVTM